MTATGAVDLGELLEQARRIAVFTGAGVSTESGIPDFRSPGGLWSQYRPIGIDEFLKSEDSRREYWRRKFELDDPLRGAEPNRGHRAIAELVRSGAASCVITQNIDGLHQKSGIPGGQVIELHGNGTFARCLDCGEKYGFTPLKQAFEAHGTLPTCGACGGFVKPATISFGQAMPEAEMRRAELETLACDLFLAVGSSLTVVPAAEFPVMAARNGAALVIVNRDPTELDSDARLVLNTEIGATLGDALGVD